METTHQASNMIFKKLLRWTLYHGAITFLNAPGPIKNCEWQKEWNQMQEWAFKIQSQNNQNHHQTESSISNTSLATPPRLLLFIHSPACISVLSPFERLH